MTKSKSHYIFVTGLDRAVLGDRSFVELNKVTSIMQMAIIQVYTEVSVISYSLVQDCYHLHDQWAQGMIT